MPKKIKKKISLRASGVCWLWIAVMVLVLDYGTKYLAKTHLSLYTPRVVMPGFNLALSFNKGAAFSFLQHQPGWQVWFLGVILLCLKVI